MQSADQFEIRHQCERLVYRFLQLLEGEQAKTADDLLRGYYNDAAN